MDVVSGKSDGVMPGFTVRDSAGVRWFVKLDPRSHPELATGAEVVSTKLFWALGYHVPQNHIALLRPSALVIDPKATIKQPDGRKRPLTVRDVGRLLRQGARRPDGTYRVVASRALEGKPLGPFQYFGTRSDDPNDIVPHEHRRSLRALGVFAAWLNHVDAKAINTLDTLVQESGRHVVRHHLLDFGSSLGSGGMGPRDYHEGHEYLYDGRSLLRAALSGGILVPSWRRISYQSPPSVGRFEADAFDASEWKPRTPNTAFLHATPEDRFWAARKIAAIDRLMIAAAVRSAKYGDPDAARYLVDTIARRREHILREYLPGVLPIVDPSLSAEGRLRFSNIAVDMDVTPRPFAYETTWYAYDNAIGSSTPLGPVGAVQPPFSAPAPLPSSNGAFVRVNVTAGHGRVCLFFRREPAGWRLVGLDREILPSDAN
jgi:hypothetical protein